MVSVSQLGIMVKRGHATVVTEKLKSVLGRLWLETVVLKEFLSDYMLKYWSDINFTPDTTEFSDEVEEAEINSGEVIVTKDQIPKESQKVSMNNELSSKYGGVVIKGLTKNASVPNILEELKKAGLPNKFSVEDLKSVERGNNISLYIYELHPKLCIKLVNNLNGKMLLNHSVKVFALVDETPEKSLPGDGKLDMLVSDLSVQPPDPLTPLSSQTQNPPSKTPLSTPVRTPTAKFWNKDADISQSSDDSSTDDESDVTEDALTNLKRKAVESPENSVIAAFEKVLTKKQRKKLRKSLDKQK